MSEKITIEQLKKIFVGKKIRLFELGLNESNPEKYQQINGVCKEIHGSLLNQGESINVEFKNGSRYSLIPEKLTGNSLEGPIFKMPKSIRRRRIELR
jgi:hypothetical protein